MMRVLITTFDAVVRVAAVSALLVCATTSGAQEDKYEFLSDASGKFAPTRILDTEAMAIDRREGSTTGWGVKTLFENPGGGSLRILYVPPGVEGAKVHYHEFHEWAYNIDGDFTNNESTTPDQYSGPLQRFRAGDFLSRPPYSLHGGEQGRQKFMASQVGAEIMIMEEGGVDAGSWCVDPDCRSESYDSSKSMKYNPDYKKVQHWSTPRIIDTWEDMPWQPMEDYPGLSVKYLVDDVSHGYRARMWFLEANAKTPDFMRPNYFERGHQFNFVINGDLRFQTYRDLRNPGQSFPLDQHYLVDRAPMSIAGLPDKNATSSGVVWLEVTYAEGTTWTSKPTPIPEPHYVD